MIRKVYEIDPLICPKCGETMRIVSFIEDYKVIDKIIDHLKLTLRQKDHLLQQLSSQYGSWGKNRIYMKVQTPSSGIKGDFYFDNALFRPSHWNFPFSACFSLTGHVFLFIIFNDTAQRVKIWWNWAEVVMNKKPNSFYDDVMQVFSLGPPLFFSFLFLKFSVF